MGVLMIDFPPPNVKVVSCQARHKKALVESARGILKNRAGAHETEDEIETENLSTIESSPRHQSQAEFSSELEGPQTDL